MAGPALWAALCLLPCETLCCRRAYVLRRTEEANLGTEDFGVAWERNGGRSTQQGQCNPTSCCGWRVAGVYLSHSLVTTLSLGERRVSQGQGVGSDSGR